MLYLCSLIDRLDQVHSWCKSIDFTRDEFGPKSFLKSSRSKVLNELSHLYMFSNKYNWECMHFSKRPDGPARPALVSLENRGQFRLSWLTPLSPLPPPPAHPCSPPINKWLYFCPHVQNEKKHAQFTFEMVSELPSISDFGSLFHISNTLCNLLWYIGQSFFFLSHFSPCPLVI